MVKLFDDILIIKTGDGYYDINTTFEANKIFELIEEEGVRGGHIGWKLKMKSDRFACGYVTFDFGRKYYGIMEEVKELIQSGKLKAKINILKDMPTKCY